MLLSAAKTVAKKNFDAKTLLRTKQELGKFVIFGQIDTKFGSKIELKLLYFFGRYDTQHNGRVMLF